MGKRRNEVILWTYVLTTSLIGLPLLGYFCSRISPISPADIPKLFLFTGLVWLFWVLNLEMIVSGFVSPLDTTSWFILTLFLLQGPTLAFVAYFLGTFFYSLFFPRAPIAKLSTITDIGLSYGISFFLIKRFWPLDFQHPMTVILGCTLIIVMALLIYLTSSAFFHSFRDKISFKESFSAGLNNAFILGIYALVFPGLSYITVVFWNAHFYAEAILLFIPFLLLRKAMQSVLKAVEEILNTIEAMVIVVEAKDPYTHYHCNRVALYAMAIARFCGLGDGAAERIGRAARIHDVGKILLKDRVLKKDGRLTEEEYDHIKLHSDPDKTLMNQIPDDVPLKEFLEIGRHHHERFDGKGYPDHIKGEAIPIEVRVISMADAWDAMTSDRVYRKGLSDETAINEIEKFKGQQWDPLVVEAFRDAHRQGVIKEVIANPDVLRYPQPTWKISPKPLVSMPNKIFEKPHGMKAFFGRYRAMIVPLMIFLFFFLLYCVKFSPFYENRLAIFAGFAALLELWEMKFLKFPRFSPVDSVYLALLFFLPISSLLTFIGVIFLIRVFYDRKVEYSKVVQLLHRVVLFGLSPLLFRWIGFSSHGNLWISPLYFKNPVQFILLTLVCVAWSSLYVLGNFLLTGMETMIRRKLWKISWYLPTLKRSVFFEIGLVTPLSLLFLSFASLGVVQFPYLCFSFTLFLATSSPLLEYFRKVIEGNAKTLEALAHAADSRFPFYAKHTEDVAKLSQEIGVSLGLSDEELESLRLATRIFGLGNVGIPDELFSKPDKLSEEERRLMQQHVEISGQIAAQYSFYKEEVPVIWSHHEWWDGSGYPSKIAGEAIPIGARILTVADSFCAMLADRPYRKAFSFHDAFEEIKGRTGTQFDPQVVQAFRRII